ncbi:hypothetical protein DXG03_007840 [Asterophora parasitica]|uniref:Uncharacterized protein n=1 Tax=Asterophora parasitica TaxID=117018 RepID=A0A9P7GDL8_9AGAR|nr:hypothetical protein DXG03_007840 [Asterophora parasitica]
MIVKTPSAPANTADHAFRREKLCRDLLLDIARHEPDVISQTFVREITLSGVLATSRSKQLNDHPLARAHTGGDGRSDFADVDVNLSEEVSEWTWTGVLPEDDILRFALSPQHSESTGSTTPRGGTGRASSLRNLVLPRRSWENLGEEERRALGQSLPEAIESYKDSTRETRAKITAAYDHIEGLAQELGKAHTRLQAALVHAVKTHPPALNARRAASDELLATRIEASLIKLSLMRARSTRALYDHRAPSASNFNFKLTPSPNPENTMAHALAAAHAKLKAEERKMRDEEAQLDRQLEEYEQMLTLVDGHGKGGGFGQVIEDWTRVQREREECIRDLRRLGWTGD